MISLEDNILEKLLRQNKAYKQKIKALEEANLNLKNQNDKKDSYNQDVHTDEDKKEVNLSCYLYKFIVRSGDYFSKENKQFKN